MTKVADPTMYAEVVRGIAIFRFMSEEEVRYLLSISEVESYEEGETIVAEGELSPYMYGIVEGSVGISIKESDGNPVYVNTIGEGDAFGEAGIFASVKRTATVTALSVAKLVRVHRLELARFMRRYPEAGNKILLVIIHGLLRKLQTANQELVYQRKGDLGQEDIDAMVANIFGEKNEQA
jgi:CRP/FNR family cyclic AMP-dependent transcriptional regulator